MRRLSLLLVGLLIVSGAVGAREIRLPQEGLLQGDVIIAPAFEERLGREMVEIEFQAWPGDKGVRAASWFTTRILAQPGDVIVIEPGTYEMQLWIFTDRVTLMTEPGTEEMAIVRGTVEVDADGVVLERIGVTNSSNETDSGHGIEVNGDIAKTITIRGCRSFGNRWTGIHMIGRTTMMREMRVIDCELVDNGMDGLDSKFMQLLYISGSTITGNGWDLSNGVGVRVGSCVEDVVIENCVIENNRSADVYGWEGNRDG